MQQVQRADLWLLCVGMAGVGLQTSFAELGRAGWAPIAAGAAQWLLLALMSSENRAAFSLARTYPGGTEAFVAAMNAKARALGMNDTRFIDPTGLSSSNVSTAHDLARARARAQQWRRPTVRH